MAAEVEHTPDRPEASPIVKDDGSTAYELRCAGCGAYYEAHSLADMEVVWAVHLELSGG